MASLDRRHDGGRPDGVGVGGVGPGASEDEVHPLERINKTSKQSQLSDSLPAFCFHGVLVIFSNANDKVVLGKDFLLF